MSSFETNAKKLKRLVDESTTIMVLQPEKPDTDSLGAALALENILGSLGKAVVLYCKDPIPEYIRVLDGWDRVSDRFPKSFDLTILVDTGGPQMIARTLEKHASEITKRPFVIIDHHRMREPMEFESIDVIDPEMAATGELLVMLCDLLDWPLDLTTAKLIVPCILADTGGLVHSNVTYNTVHTVAEMVKMGVNLSELNERWQAASALDADLLTFKAKLLERSEYFDEGRIASVIVTPAELKEFADRYDPSELVIQDLRRVKGVMAVVTLRDYGGKIKVSIRANYDIAAPTAQAFGGGGHMRAAGCTITDMPAEEAQTAIVKELSKLTAKVNETLQHANT